VPSSAARGRLGAAGLGAALYWAGGTQRFVDGRAGGEEFGAERVLSGLRRGTGRPDHASIVVPAVEVGLPVVGGRRILDVAVFVTLDYSG